MIGDKLRYLREKNGYTQRKVADFLNIDRSTYSYYETGKTRPDIETLKKLANLFHVSIDYIAENNVRLRNERAAYTTRSSSVEPLSDNGGKYYSAVSQFGPGRPQKVGDMVIQILSGEREGITSAFFLPKPIAFPGGSMLQ